MLVANVFLDRLQSETLASSSRSHFVRAWVRYVDDVLCIWCGPTNEARSFHEDLNTYDPGIDFTLEVGGDTICFFDL